MPLSFPLQRIHEVLCCNVHLFLCRHGHISFDDDYKPGAPSSCDFLVQGRTSQAHCKHSWSVATLDTVPLFEVEGCVVSGTHFRETVTAGKMSSAFSLPGLPSVRRCKAVRLGGRPVLIDSQLLPKRHVYIVKTELTIHMDPTKNVEILRAWRPGPLSRDRTVLD
ncbi:hypothetical protein HYDPIDRAFT_105909 [Hydnomerulius pinastri MD-312]|nr:hypothetical protein HYDPIDRAFT_105909 [Hydnomerulius pinastri MD-312]